MLHPDTFFVMSKHVGDDPLSCTEGFLEPKVNWRQFGLMNLNAVGLASTDGQHLLISSAYFPVGSLDSKAGRDSDRLVLSPHLIKEETEAYRENIY